MTRKEVEVVVAHYAEDLSWLSTLKPNTTITIYTKGPLSPSNKTFIPLPNIGREGHTYLHHIVTHYHDLAPVTLFTQGKIYDHVSETIEELVAEAEKLGSEEILTCKSRELKLFDAWEGVHCDLADPKKGKRPLRAPYRPGDYFAHFFGNGRLPLSIGFNPATIFGVPRELIHRHSLHFYQILLSTLFLGSNEHNDPETGHIMEAFWLAMWKPEEYICWDESDVAMEERNEKGELGKGRWMRGKHCIRLQEGGKMEVGVGMELGSEKEERVDEGVAWM